MSAPARQPTSVTGWRFWVVRPGQDLLLSPYGAPPVEGINVLRRARLPYGWSLVRTTGRLAFGADGRDVLDESRPSVAVAELFLRCLRGAYCRACPRPGAATPAQRGRQPDAGVAAWRRNSAGIAGNTARRGVTTAAPGACPAAPATATRRPSRPRSAKPAKKPAWPPINSVYAPLWSRRGPPAVGGRTRRSSPTPTTCFLSEWLSKVASCGELTRLTSRPCHCIQDSRPVGRRCAPCDLPSPGYSRTTRPSKPSSSMARTTWLPGMPR